MLISLGSDRLRSVSLLHWWQKMKKKDAWRKKKIMLNPAYKNVGRRSLGVCLRLFA
jgi:hypothetical protein